jgi:cell division protein FtsL
MKPDVVCVTIIFVYFRLNDANKAVIESREKIERQNQQLSDYEAEINLLRRRLETLESDRDKDKKQIATLQDALNRVRMVRSVILSESVGLRFIT